MPMIKDIKIPATKLQSRIQIATWVLIYGRFADLDHRLHARPDDAGHGASGLAHRRHFDAVWQLGDSRRRIADLYSIPHAIVAGAGHTAQFI